MAEFIIRKASAKDEEAVLEVFNYYVANSYAAYSEEPEGSQFFDRLRRISTGYPFYVAESGDGKVIGFALLHPYYGIPVFRRVSRITYFIHPDFTRKGLGRMFLDRLIVDAIALGIDCIMASISSLNEPSINFHARNGFVECGRFKNIGRKWNKDFDEVWMQKLL
jgi:L-amino acid N-acyltransferase YncA